MGKIIAIIEKSEDGGYGIHTPNVNGLFGYGLTEDEAKESLQEALDSQLEYFDETGKEIPELLKGEITFEYKYDLSAFLKVSHLSTFQLLPRKSELTLLLCASIKKD